MSKLVIKRSQWLRGEGDAESRLLRGSDNKKCCLGFLAISCGATEDQITDEPSPEEATNLNWPEGLLDKYKYSTAVCLDLMEINDSALNEPTREVKLTKLFGQIGIEVEFVD